MFNQVLKQYVRSIILLSFLFCSFHTFADQLMQTTDETPNIEAHQAIIDSPDLIIKALIKQLLILSQENNLPSLVTFLQQKMASYIDFDYIAQWSLGRNYRKLNPQQQQRLKTKLTQFILTAISERFEGYQTQQIQFLPVQLTDPEQATTTLLIQEIDGQVDAINFRFYATQSGWKIFDITHNGHSLLQAYHRYFNPL